MQGELRQEMRDLRLKLTAKIGKSHDELRADIGNLDERLRVVEIDLAAIRTHLLGFDVRAPRNETQHEPS